jgi:hypothetical protein
MHTVGRVLLVFVSAGAVAAACSAGPKSTFGSGGGATTTGSGASTANTGSGSSPSTGAGNSGLGGGIAIDAGATTGTGATNCVVTDMNADMDGDGWTPAQGDCNDCDPNVNPGAVDVLHTPDGGPPYWGNEDCQNKPGPLPTCDANLAVDDADPIHAANAIELCMPLTDPKKWGLKSATWVLPDGSPPSALTIVEVGSPPQPLQTMAQALANYDLGHGILSKLGANVKVQAGVRMLGLSSGTAREPTDPNYFDVSGFDKLYTVNSPMGFPKESPACPNVVTGQPHDGVALELAIVAPTNATGFSFYFNFLTYEWPTWICSIYNDFFTALLYPIPMGQTDGNITFDSMGNPVTVNNAFLTVCGPPGTYGGKNFTCPLGTMDLIGTGFGIDTAEDMHNHGSTFWLETKAPVDRHEDFTLRFAVYDSSDGVYDTTVLVDNFQWIANGSAVVVSTAPVPTAK